MKRQEMVDYIKTKLPINNAELAKMELSAVHALYVLNGGEGSGNFGHSGIPEQVGGSGPGGGGGSSFEKATKRQKLTIDKATSLLQQRGIDMKFSTGQYDHATKTTTYELKDKSGKTKRMSAKEIHSFLMTDKSEV